MARVPGFAGRRFNRILAGGLALLVLIWCAEIKAWAHPLILPVALVLWAYLLSALLLLEWAILRILRRGAPALPFGPASWNGKRAALGVLFAIAAGVTLLREGALAPDFVLDMSWSSTQTQTHTSATTGSSEAHTGRPVRLAGRYVDCTLLQCGSGALCDAFRAHFRCDNNDPKRPRPARVAMVSGNVSFPPDPFCYMPLDKSADVAFSAFLTVGGTNAGGNKSVSIQLHDSISQATTGLCSCYAFRRQIGFTAANLVADELNQVLRHN